MNDFYWLLGYVRSNYSGESDVTPQGSLHWSMWLERLDTRRIPGFSDIIWPKNKNLPSKHRVFQNPGFGVPQFPTSQLPRHSWAIYRVIRIARWKRSVVTVVELFGSCWQLAAGLFVFWLVGWGWCCLFLIWCSFSKAPKCEFCEFCEAIGVQVLSQFASATKQYHPQLVEVYALDLHPAQDAIVANEGLGWDSRS